MTALETTYANRDAAARAWKSAGGRVVGVLGATVPVELITAAGMLPVRLVGDPSLPLDLGRPWIEDTREGYLKSVFERLLAGDFAHLDLLVIPRGSEGLLQFHYLLDHVQQTRPDLPVPPVYLFDLLQTPFDATIRYVRARMLDLRARLAALSGQDIPDTAIAAAIASHNRRRAALRALGKGRRAVPAQVDGRTMLMALGCDQTLPEAPLMDLLAGLAPAVPPSDAVRLMVKGMPMEHDDLYRAIEDRGGVIVADDHDWGEGLVAVDVDESAPWVEALTDHYMRHMPGPRRFPQADADAEFLVRALAAGVQGVVFALEENDDTLGWDYPAQKRALDNLGIPSLLLTRQSYRGPDDRSLAAIAAFVAECRA